MKNKTQILLLILSLYSFLGYGQTLTIEEAVEQNKIDCIITGSWDYNDPKEFLDADGQYFGKCMTISIRNKNNSAIEIYIENGLMLMCEDTTVQDMVVTKPAYVYLEPRQKKTVELYAMCSEYHDNMPGKQKKYRVGKKGEKELIRISKVIDEMFMHNLAGQGAVWAFTDQVNEKDLRKYGATDKSLEITIEILNEANVYTKINPEIIEKPVISDNIKTQSDELSNSSSNKYGVTVDWLYIYIGAGVVLALLVYGVYITIRLRRKRNNEI
jgi:hypothetical protein